MRGRSAPGEESTVAYDLDVRYSYEIDGEIHESTQVMFYFLKWSTTFRSIIISICNACSTERGPLQVSVHPRARRKACSYPVPTKRAYPLAVRRAVMMFVCPFFAFFLDLLAVSSITTSSSHLVSMSQLSLRRPLVQLALALN